MSFSRRILGLASAGSIFLAGVGVGGGVGLTLGAGLYRYPTSGGERRTPPVSASNLWGQHTPRSRPQITGARDPARAAAPSADIVRARTVQPGGLRPSVVTAFSPEIRWPQVHESAYVDPLALIAGAVEVGSRVYVAPFASVRADEGQPIHVGEGSNLQDGVVVHALQTLAGGESVEAHTYEVGGQPYAVYLGSRVSLAHQAQIHGPARIEDDVLIGMQSLIFRAHIGRGCVVEPASTVIGVEIAEGRYVPAGSVITLQTQADELPEITDGYAHAGANQAAVRVNQGLAAAYAGHGAPASTAPR